MKRFLLLLCLSIIFSCQQKSHQTDEPSEKSIASDTIPAPELTFQQAENLANLPLNCIDKEYPNKMGHVTATPEDQKRPKEQHPAFYGCFDWHSAVHGHWSAVTLLKQFPALSNRDELMEILTQNITPENIAKEIAYLNTEHNTSFERTYGWAWLLKLQQELDSWNVDEGKKMAAALRPLTDLVVERYMEYLPKLNYAIRVGEHSNTAFAMAFAWDFAEYTDDSSLKEAIRQKAEEFYLEDENCPVGWEPSGYDFLSPCLEEVDIMRRVLPSEQFHEWLTRFLPGLEDGKLDMEVGEVSDRTDGKLVHIDGLNLSRAWVLYGLVAQYPRYRPLLQTAHRHIAKTLPNLVADDYEGGHWLGSFAIYALQQADKVEKDL